jgi:hypothetical protein
MKKMSPAAEKKLLFALILTWTALAPLGTLSMMEVITDVKYAPVDSLYKIYAFALVYSLPGFFLYLRFAKEATQKTLMLLVAMGMLNPIVIPAITHYANLAFSDANIYTVDVPVEHTSRQRRSPRGGESFIAYRLHLNFQDVKIDGTTLNGEHIVFVSEESYKAHKKDPLFRLSLKKGPLGAYHLRSDDMVNLGR